MKPILLEILRCPLCAARLQIAQEATNDVEIRSGSLCCEGPGMHDFPVQEGIVWFATGFGDEAVQRELAYEDTTYQGDQRLRDPMTIAQFPDTLSELWPGTRYFGPDFRALIERFKVGPGDWVLDIGTGACWTTRLLAQQGARTVALDLSAADFYGLKAADTLFSAHNIYFERVLESMTKLPFADEAFSSIFFNASFHHTPDALRTLRECFRVLKPGGAVGMVNEAFESWRHRWLSIEENLTDLGSHHEISYGDLEAAVASAGFQVRYDLAGHVRGSLRRRLPALGARITEEVFNRFPIFIKQLKSAEVILTKGAGTIAALASQSAQLPVAFTATEEDRPGEFIK